MSGKIYLKWNDFQKDISNSFQGLREKMDFCDVTLVCDEDKQIEAHKVILSACSPFFSSVLKRNKHSHPLIYMRGLKFKNLVAIVDFIYHGEANIFQEDLDGFLAIAEELKLRGLSGTCNKELLVEKKEYQPEPKTLNKAIAKQDISMNPHDINVDIEENVDDYSHLDQTSVHKESSKLIVKVDIHSEDLQATIDTMIERIQTEEGNQWKCTVCEKLGKDKRDLKRHIECHIAGVTHLCIICGKVSRSSKGLINHMSIYHRK